MLPHACSQALVHAICFMQPLVGLKAALLSLVHMLL